MEYGIKDGIQLGESTVYGKPYLKRPVGVYFNISHCKSCVAVAVSEYEVGIDVEKITCDYSLANIVLSKKERESLSNRSLAEGLFARYWTLKESYVKMLGVGLSDQVKDLDFSNNDRENFHQYHSVFKSISSGDYMISSCAQEELEMVELEWELLITSFFP